MTNLVIHSFLLAVVVSRVQSSPLLGTNDLVEEIDSKFLSPTLTDPTSGLGENVQLPRYLLSSLTNWLNSVGWKTYGDYSHYLTLPDKSLPLTFNASSQTVHALVGNLVAVGLGAYLLSFLPTATSVQSYGSDTTGYPDLGHGLARDQDFYDLYQESDYDYQYPDSLDDWDIAGPGVFHGSKRKRIKSDRMGDGAGGKRRRQGERRRPVRPQGPGLMESLLSTLLGPLERMGTAVVDPQYFLTEFARRYDEYWRRRRGDPVRKLRRKAQFRTQEEAEVELPWTEDMKSGQDNRRKNEPWWSDEGEQES
jgi:hypothetical protein